MIQNIKNMLQIAYFNNNAIIRCTLTCVVKYVCNLSIISLISLPVRNFFLYCIKKMLNFTFANCNILQKVVEI